MSNALSFDEYQRLACRTALYPGHDEPTVAPYPALGLAGEAGEVCEQIKKSIRDDGGEISDERRHKLHKELGDVLWYVAALCAELDLQMEDVARGNIEKLADRHRRGVIRGDGDER